MYSAKVCLASIWIAIGLVCSEEIVGLEIKRYFFNIMFFDDKYYAYEFSSNLHKQHQGAYMYSFSRFAHCLSKSSIESMQSVFICEQFG